MNMVFIAPRKLQSSVINNLKSRTFGISSTHSLALKSNNLWASGQKTYTGRSSISSSDYYMVDTGISNVSAVYCGNGHSFIIKTDGTLWATGSGANGLLGQGNTNDSFGTWLQINIPEVVVKVLSISGDSTVAIALTASGNIYTWGSDIGNTGMFGTGQTGGTQYVPTKVTQFYDGSLFGNVTDVNVTRKTVVCLHSDKTLSICGMSSGSSFSGQSGPPTQGGAFNKPYKITTIINIDSLATVYEGGCFCLKGTDLYCFGQFTEGQLGDGSVGSQHITQPTLLNSTTKAIFCDGGQSAFRINTSNVLQGAGYNSFFALGFSTSPIRTWTDIIGSFNEQSIPVSVNSATTEGSFIRTNNGIGNIYFAGKNANGAGGQGNNTNSYYPHVAVPGFSLGNSWYQADALVALDANVGADIQNSVDSSIVTKLNQSWGGTGTYPALNTGEHKFGTKSIVFVNQGGLRFDTLTSTVANNFGTTDFTVHYWVKATSYGGSSNPYNLVPIVKYSYAGQSGSGNHSVTFHKELSGKLSVTHNNATAGNPIITTTMDYSTVWLNAWHHVALVYVASTRTLTFYYDGVSKASVVFTVNPGPTSGLALDCTMYDSGTFYIDRYEIVPRALFNANFNPATDLYV